jgi:hypothetical protein
MRYTNNMTNNEKCTRCNDYIRDCICEECLSCHELVGAGELNEDGECEECEDAHARQGECAHEEYFRSFTPRGENIWQCEDCGAITLETDTDESEDGFGKRETPEWG